MRLAARLFFFFLIRGSNHADKVGGSNQGDKGRGSWSDRRTCSLFPNVENLSQRKANSLIRPGFTCQNKVSWWRKSIGDAVGKGRSKKESVELESGCGGMTENCSSCTIYQKHQNRFQSHINYPWRNRGKIDVRLDFLLSLKKAAVGNRTPGRFTRAFVFNYWTVSSESGRIRNDRFKLEVGGVRPKYVVCCWRYYCCFFTAVHHQ